MTKCVCIHRPYHWILALCCTILSLSLSILILNVKIIKIQNDHISRINFFQRLCSIYIHTYIHNWPLQPISQDYGLASHTTHVVCVNFMREWWGLQFNVDSERQIFEKLFHGNFYLLSEFLPEICWEEVAEEIFFVFRFDVWPGTRTLAFRLISQHTTY